MSARESLVWSISPEVDGPSAGDLLDAYRAEVLAEVTRLFQDRGNALLDGGITTGHEAAELIRQYAAGQAGHHAPEAVASC